MDRYRNTGPELSVPPMLVNPKPSNQSEVNGLFMKTKLVPKASGSAYFEMDQVKICVTVHGPRQVKNVAFLDRGDLKVELKFATFAQEKRRNHQRDNEEKQLSLLIEQAIKPSIRLLNYPKQQIDIWITVLECNNNHQCLPAAISATSLAIVDAGLEVFDLVVAASVNIIINDDKMNDQSDSIAKVMVARMPNLHLVTATHMTGPPLPLPQVRKAINDATDLTNPIHQTMITVLNQSL